MGYYVVIMGYSGLLWVIPGYYGVLSHPSYLRIIVLSWYNVLFFNICVAFSEINIFPHLINSSNLF